jgi:hypothetical protein
MVRNSGLVYRKRIFRFAGRTLGGVSLLDPNSYVHVMVTSGGLWGSPI